MPRLPKSSATVGAIVLFLVLGFGLFCSTGHDDSHITYWVAHSLQKFGQLLNYNGERIEQSSSLAHVLLLALLGAVTRVSLPTLGPITSIVSGVVAIVLVGKLGRLAAPKAPRGAELLLGTAACFVYWGFGGLETTLVAAAAVWAILECSLFLTEPSRRGLGRAAGAIMLYLTARPESPLVLGCVIFVALAYSVLRRRHADPEEGPFRAIGPALVLAAVAASEAALLFGFRRLYFGVFFPNPVYSKAPGIEVGEGLAYLWDCLSPANLWIVPAVGVGLYHTVNAALDEREPQFAAVLSGAFAVAYLGFLILVGGDWMTGGRFLAHVFPVLCVITMVALERGIKKGWRNVERTRLQQAAIVLLGAANLQGLFSLAYQESTGRQIWTTSGLREQVDARVGERGFSWFEITNYVHLRDTPVTAAVLDLIGEIRTKAPEKKLVIMSSQAGMVTYHAFKANYGSLRFVDICSLATRDFMHCLAADELDYNRFGKVMSYESYFFKHASIDASCGTTRPDIVFGLAPRRIEPILKENGYIILYTQRGPMRGERSKKRRTADAFMSDEFVAVDMALVEKLGLTKKDRWVWDIR